VKARLINYSMAVLVALAIVFSIRSVGIMLLISLLTMPAVIAGSLTHNYRRIFPWAAAVAVVGNVAGLWFSVALGVPASAATIFTMTVGLVAVKVLPLRLKRKA
jgi:zinc transport system permease protein